MSVEDKLTTGLKALGFPRGGELESRLLAYVTLLEKWNQTYNLTAVRDPEQMVAQHMLDSLSVVEFLAGAGALIDIGSGAGLPGIPISMASPRLQVSLLDSNFKKVAFLRQAKVELQLHNVNVLAQRAEACRPSGAFDVVISRAFADLREFIDLAGHLCRPGGTLIAMKGLYPHEELTRVPANFPLQRVAEVHVPEVQGQRHVVILRRVDDAADGVA
jgi:16S rRNA (guanine527-N7)-methyltransferase